MALDDATSEIGWFQSLIAQRVLSETPVFWCDNMRATYLNVNHVFHNKMKHFKLLFTTSGIGSW